MSESEEERKEFNNNIHDLHFGPKNIKYLNVGDISLFEIFSQIFNLDTTEKIKKELGNYFLVDQPDKREKLWNMYSKVKEIPYELTYTNTQKNKPHLHVKGYKNNISHDIYYDEEKNKVFDDIYERNEKVGKYEIDFENDEITKTINGESKEPIKLGTGYAGSIFSKIKDKVKNKIAEISQPEINKLWDKITELEDEIKELNEALEFQKERKVEQNIPKVEQNIPKVEERSFENDSKPKHYNFLDDIKKFNLSELIKTKPVQPKIEEQRKALEHSEQSDLSKILSERRKDIEYSDDEEEDYDWGEGYKRKPKERTKTISLSEFLRRYS